MSRTDKDKPYKIRPRRYDGDRWAVKGGRHSWKAALRLKHLAHERRAVADDLHRGQEPINEQHRHRAKWDAW